MTMNVKGAPDMVDHNGTAGWGVSNRLIDPRALLGLEIAWFMYNGSRGAMGATADALSPVANVLGADLPHGFFLMVKRAGALVPQIKLLDEKILAQDHAYAVQLGGEYVDFFNDGENVGTFRNPRRVRPSMCSGCPRRWRARRGWTAVSRCPSRNTTRSRRL